MKKKSQRKQEASSAGTSPGGPWQRLVHWYATRSPIWVFAVKFALLMSAYYALVLWPACDRVLYVYLKMNAWLASGILTVLGQPNHLTDVTIASSKFIMAVRRGCDAVEPTWLFCAAVLAFPVPFWRKLGGILAGIILLQVLNLARIVSLYFIGVHLPNLFNTAHLELWPAVFILAAILLWVCWMQWAKGSEPGPWRA